MRRFGWLVCLAAFFTMPACADTEIRPFVSGSYQQIVSARQGKPFILNFWSLSCTYCKDEMAMLGRLAAKYPGLDLVLVSTDTPEEEKAVSAALAKLSLDKAEAWLFADSYVERLRYEIDRKWQGELPRTCFSGANNEIRCVSGKLGQQEVERWVREQYGYR